MPPADAPAPAPGVPAAWFYADNGTPRGPVDEAMIVRLLQAGTVTPQTKVWSQGTKEWRSLADTPLAACLARLGPPPVPAAPPLPPPIPPIPTMPHPAAAAASPAPAQPPPAPAAAPAPRADGITPLTVQPGSDARSSFATTPGPNDDAPGQSGGPTKTGIPFWTARMAGTILGGLMARGIEPRHFDWLMPLESLELTDNRAVDGGYCGVTTNGAFHVCFHRAGEGFYYAAMPATAAMTRAEVGPSAAHLTRETVRFFLSFPAATGLRAAASPVLTAELLDGLTTGWLTFWRPAIDAAWGKHGQDFALGRVTEILAEENGFGTRAHFTEDFVVCFRPAKTGMEFFPEPDFEGAALREWSAGHGVVELEYLKPGETPMVWRVFEHVAAGDSEALPSWLATLNFGAATHSETLLSERMRDQGAFEWLWEGETEPAFRLISRSGETIALESTDGGERVVFERGGFVAEDHALAVTAEGRCARLTLANPQEFDSLARFAPEAERWGAWPDGTVGCGVLIQNDDLTIPPLPARFTLTPEGFGVGPLKDVPLRNDDGLRHAKWSQTISLLEVRPGAGAPNQPAPGLTILLPHAQAFRLWEEWDVAHALADLDKASVGGFYRGFNEARKLDRLAVLFSDFVLLDQALDEGMDLEQASGKLEEAGAEMLAQDTALRDGVASKILALVLTLPGIRQKLEVMASMFPYYWVHQEVAWIEAAFGAEAASEWEPSLRKRAVPLVRREVRAIQENLVRALGEIDAAARPIDELLTRNGVRKAWKARTEPYQPIGIRGASALPVLAVRDSADLLAGVIQDAEFVQEIGRAAQTIFPWWRVFLHALETAQFEFGQFVDEEDSLAMERDRARLEKVPDADRKAATARLVGALRARIVEGRRNRFAEVLVGSGVRRLAVVDPLENTVKHSARRDVDAFIKMLLPPGSDDPVESVGRAGHSAMEAARSFDDLAVPGDDDPPAAANIEGEPLDGHRD